MLLQGLMQTHVLILTPTARKEGPSAVPSLQASEMNLAGILGDCHWH